MVPSWWTWRQKAPRTKILNSLRTKCGDDNLLSQFLTCSRDSKKKKSQFSFLFSYFLFPVKSNKDLAFGGLHSLPGFPGFLSKYSSSSVFSHLAKLEHPVLSDLTTIRASCPFLLRVKCPLPFSAYVNLTDPPKVIINGHLLLKSPLSPSYKRSFAISVPRNRQLLW